MGIAEFKYLLEKRWDKIAFWIHDLCGSEAQCWRDFPLGNPTSSLTRA